VADRTGATEASAGSQAAKPKLAQWFVLYTVGRLAIAAALIGLLWLLGLPGTPGFLFGVLLAMPVSFLVLSPVRKRLTGALVVRQERKEALRAQLRGPETDDGDS
jgi:Protein of unknown function (DUF4229)